MEEQTLRPELDLPAAQKSDSRKYQHKEPAIVQHIAQQNAEAGAGQKSCRGSDHPEDLDPQEPAAAAEKLGSGTLQTDLLAQPLIGCGGCVHQVFIGKQVVEALLLKGGTLVAHVHLLLDKYISAAVHVQRYIA